MKLRSHDGSTGLILEVAVPWPFMRLDLWFLNREERGNPFSEIDHARAPGTAWSTNNNVRFLIDGAAYFEQLARIFESLVSGDELRFTDWRSDGDERLGPTGRTISECIVRACRDGVDVRGLLWRSHSDLLAFSAKENRRFARKVTRSGGEVLLDERVRRGGSHHQKLLIFRHPDRPKHDVAYIGGIDLSHGRDDDSAHHGDTQVIKLDNRYGPRPAWHDVQFEVQGPAVNDLDTTFRERWQDPTPLNYSGDLRRALSSATSRDRVASPLRPELPDPPNAGRHAVQVLRTYPSRRIRYPFAPAGERSIARGFAKALQRARTLIYLEDQYFWSFEIAQLLARALQRNPRLQLIVVVPRFPDKDGMLSGPPSRFAQERAIDVVKSAGGDRVGVYDLHNDTGSPIYVHAKVCIIDDVWVTVGSDNLNRRSWTHDSELSCAVLDEELDERAPLDPGGLGDGSRRFARDLRLKLWAEHLERAVDDPELLDIAGASALWKNIAKVSPERNEIIPSNFPSTPRIREHFVAPVSGIIRLWAAVAYRLIFDPDGRPLRLRYRHRF
jgi:phosphatidylserine/phosphatidylglycerophosphate/cardiolipin synthase-like enzyme